MPRYFFHVKRGQVTVLDQDGVELADIDKAAKEAARREGEIAALDTWQAIGPHGRVIVADDQWLPVFEVTSRIHGWRLVSLLRAANLSAL
jgi:hypothetical protein